MDLLDIPEHILIKMCELSSVNELRDLMRTCQYFHDLVSNTKTLMVKFRFIWRPDQRRGVVQKSIRKYQKVSMTLIGAYRKSTVALFEKFAPSLEEFEINYNSIKSRDLQLLLTYLAPSNKIRVANFKLLYYRQSSEFNNEDIVQILSLKELRLENSDCRILQHFQGMQLNKFIFIISRQCYMHEKALVEFLKTQKSLVSLELSAGAIPNVFIDDFSELLDFKLQELKITLKNLTEKEAGNLNKFLKKQAGSLKTAKIVVEVGSLQSIAIMLNHVNLLNVHLEFQSLIFRDDFLVGSLCNVTHLVLDTRDLPKEENIVALNSFKNLIELTLVDMELNQALFNVLKDLPKLKKINFMDVKLKAFGTIPQVTEMVFHNVKFKIITNFLKVNRQVIKVKVSGEEYVHAGYLMIVLKKYKNVKHIDLSQVNVDWAVDRIFLITISKFGGDLNTLVLPKYMRNKRIMKELPTTIVNIKFA